MMDNLTMTEKEILVLIHFVEKESEVSSSDNKEDNHFFTYPGKIEGELKGKVSRVHAKEVCDKFVKKDILEIDTNSTSNKKNYFIKPGIDVFKKIVCLLIQNLDKSKSIEVLGYDYFQSKINESFVKKILFERNVTFRRKLEVLGWETAEAKKLFENKMANKKITINASPSELLKSGKSVKDLVKELPDSDITSFDIYAQRKLNRIGDPEYKNYHNQFYPVELEMTFPVLDIADKKDIDYHINKIRNLNENLFQIYPGLISCTSAIFEHFRRWQEDQIIMPILLFITASPTALIEFMCKSWDSNDSNFCFDNLAGTIEPTMEKLMFLVISDLTLTGSYPKNSLITKVEISPIINKLDGEEKHELLSFETYKGQIFYFNRCIEISSNECGSITRSPFTLYDKGKTYPQDIIDQVNDCIKKIKDYSPIINYLKSADKPVAKVISSNFSSYLNNLIYFCDSTANFPEELIMELNTGIIEVLLNENWSELLHLGFQELSDKSKYLLELNLNEHYKSHNLRRSLRIDVGESILYDVLNDEAFSVVKK